MEVMRVVLGCVMAALFCTVACGTTTFTPTATLGPQATSTTTPPLTLGPEATATTTPTFTLGPQATATTTPTFTLGPGATSTTTPTPTLEPQATATTVPHATQAGSSSVGIALFSPDDDVRPGQRFSVEVSLDPRGRGISGVQMRTEYDPEVLQVAKVTPGGLLGEKAAEVQSIIPLIDIGSEPGILSYADARVGVTKPPTPAGVFATIEFRVLESAPTGNETVLKITEVKIADENILEIMDVAVGDALRVMVSP